MIRLCKDCRWFDAETEKCTHEKVRYLDLVRGEWLPASCRLERATTVGQCGALGILFEFKGPMP